MIRIDTTLTAASLRNDIDHLFDLSAAKIFALQRHWRPAAGSPVVTVEGKYTSLGWTEWTQGFQFGSPILQLAATGDRRALAIGREGTVRHMAGHVSHVGVHDHGFNNVSTYGNLYNLAVSGAMRADASEIRLYELALRVSGAVQASRWTDLPVGLGYIYSFNGPHSLFADTIRSLRILALSHRFGHVLMGENDRRISLLARFLRVARATADFFIENTPADGVPYWDTGAPGLAGLGDHLGRPADPFNNFEPVDSSAAAIAAQGLIRLGRHLSATRHAGAGARYLAAGLTMARTIFSEPYLSTSPRHQGLLLHTVYHRPNGWDHVPRGRKVPCGESCMWGDYHARELALLLKRMIERKPYYTFFGL
jgi:hypothetical protein